VVQLFSVPPAPGDHLRSAAAMLASTVKRLQGPVGSAEPGALFIAASAARDFSTPRRVASSHLESHSVDYTVVIKGIELALKQKGSKCGDSTI
jgi:hypothetical protein